MHILSTRVDISAYSFHQSKYQRIFFPLEEILVHILSTRVDISAYSFHQSRYQCIFFPLEEILVHILSPRGDIGAYSFHQRRYQCIFFPLPQMNSTYPPPLPHLFFGAKKLFICLKFHLTYLLNTSSFPILPPSPTPPPPLYNFVFVNCSREQYSANC